MDYFWCKIISAYLQKCNDNYYYDYMLAFSRLGLIGACDDGELQFAWQFLRMYLKNFSERFYNQR